MDVDSSFGSGQKSNKRSFVEALREFTSQQITPAPKRLNQGIESNTTDTIRVEVNKV